MENFRKTTDFQEILNRLNTMIYQERNVLIWQSVDEQRQVYPALITSLNAHEETFTLTPVGEYEFDIQKNATLYTKGSYENILFKQRVVEFDAKKIVLSFPEEIFLHEHRELERTHYNFPKNKVMLNVSKYKKERSFQEHEAYLRDISPQGISFYVKKDSTTALNSGEEICLTRLGAIDFLTPLVGKIVYRKAEKLRKKGKDIQLLRYGVSLKLPLKEKTLLRLGGPKMISEN